MEKFWKWAGRVAWIVAIISFIKEWIVGASVMEFIKQLWINLTPWQLLLFLAVIVIIIRFVIFLVKINKIGKNVDLLVKDMDDLKNWIDKFRYKQHYSDLKGKINFYIRKELEKYAIKKKPKQ